jgi:hypothetical protein
MEVDEGGGRRGGEEVAGDEEEEGEEGEGEEDEGYWEGVGVEAGLGGRDAPLPPSDPGATEVDDDDL